MNEPLLPNLTDTPFGDFFSLSSEVMCLIDAESRFRLANSAVKKILGHLPGALQGKAFIEFVHSEDATTINDSLTTLLDGTGSTGFACRFRCANGEYKWLLWQLYLKHGLVYAIAKDLTPFRQLEDLENARNSIAEALLDTILAINSSLSLHEVFKRILSNVGKVVDYDHVNIMLIEDGYAYIADYQNTAGISTDDQTVRSLRMEVDNYYYLHYMSQTNRSVIVYDIDADPTWERIPHFHISGCYLGSPISVEDQVIGFLNVIKLKKNFYTTLHARHLLTFAHHVGVAINNAQLYEQIKIITALEERQRLARELHDSVSQSLYAAHALATLIPRVYERQPEKTLEYAAKIGQRISGALDQMRLILIELYPDSITQTELGILLKQLCAAFTESTGLPVRLTVTDKILLAKDAQIAYYRIAQEALHNIEKHASATQVTVKLFRDGDSIILVVQDNGRGFEVSQIPQAHFGVRNLFERAQAIGAVLQIESEIGRGTHITLEGTLQ
jgi:PAS domain S-box-containing protein